MTRVLNRIRAFLWLPARTRGKNQHGPAVNPPWGKR